MSWGKLSAILIVLWPALASAQSVTSHMVPMRDNVRLATDVYVESGWFFKGPALLVRTPYNRTSPAHVNEGENLGGALSWFVVIQDTRGVYASEGIDSVFRTDGVDGADAVAWVAEHDECNGDVGTFGGSATGVTQYLLAKENPPALRCQWVQVATTDVYQHWVYQGGVFRKSFMEAWLGQPARGPLLPEIEAHAVLGDYWDPVRLEGRYDQVNVPVFHTGGWYDMFLQGTLDAFVGFQNHGGPGARGQQKLVVGPWVHAGLFKKREQGELTYPSNSIWDFGDFLDDWFKWCLRGWDTGVEEWPAVTYYLMGDVDDPGAPGNAWRSSETWPPPESTDVAYHLQPGGELRPRHLPNGSSASRFTSDPNDPVPTVCGANLVIPAGPCDQRVIEARSGNYVCHPQHQAAPNWGPRGDVCTPSCGGMGGSFCSGTTSCPSGYESVPGGPSFDCGACCREIDAPPSGSAPTPAASCDASEQSCGDVLVFTSPVLTEPLELTGRIRAQLYVSTDVPDADLMVRLTDVYPDGRSMLVTDGALRLRFRNGFRSEEPMQPGVVSLAEVDLWSTALVVNAGHRVRISISGTNSPRFDVNPQTGEPFRRHTTTRVGEIVIHHSPGYPSAIILPVMGAEPAPDGGPVYPDGAPDGDPDGGMPDGDPGDSPGVPSTGPDGGPQTPDSEPADVDASPGDPQTPVPIDDEAPPIEPSCATLPVEGPGLLMLAVFIAVHRCRRRSISAAA